MSVDEVQHSQAFGREVVVKRRRRRNHRSQKRTPVTKKFQRILAILFLGSLVIAASMYFAQTISEYEPPPHVYQE